ncbi:MAG: hypothetical protein KAJ10_03670 [Thermodesulfovibrionia bacterium]|nr:hypothetical protein [Thermodesulfovibrionia bacterium]
MAIPLDDKIRIIFDKLTTKEIAELSRASYFVGHWHPSLLPRLFDTTKGESWKVTNCADQILRERLEAPHNIEIHDGKLRVTFSSRHCWLWEEFGLATESNLEIFKTCKLPFGESTLNKSADKLKNTASDLWPSPDSIIDNDLYREFLELQKTKVKADIKKRFADKIAALEQSKKNAQKEIEFLLACNGHGLPVDNVIHYNHTDTFCFGWRDKLTIKEAQSIKEGLGDMVKDYKIEFKTV